MAYTLDFAFQTGAGGLSDLRAQLVDTTGASVGSAVSTGFVDIGSGFYLWHYAAIPDSHRGGVKFYSNASPSTILYFAAINPQTGENVDAKISTVSASVATFTVAHGGNVAGFVYIKRGDTLAAVVSGLGDLTGYVTVDFTVKVNVDDDDSAALVRIRKNASGLNDGLLVLNGATGAGVVTAADGSITMPADLTTGIITVNLIAADTKQLTVSATRVWDVQVIKASSVTTPANGTCVVQADVTRLVV